MSEHIAILSWKRTAGEADFLKGRYSREHTWTFDGGAVVPASPSSIVPLPYSNPALVDPEEAFVAAASSCHMLTFLFVAGKRGFLVDSYEDRSVGVMTKNEKGVLWVSVITLHPKIVFGGGKQPTAEDLDQLHHVAHEQCFIANSVKSEIKVEPVS
jgi:organic hydroperoxide reductase OsmC/OhrA